MYYEENLVTSIIPLTIFKELQQKLVCGSFLLLYEA